MNFGFIFVALFYILGLILGPLAIAVASKLWDGSRLSDWAVGVGLKSVWKPSLTFDAANELTLKRRSLDEDHDQEEIAYSTGLFGSLKRHIFDPQDRTHEWFGTPFSFVDERFGIAVDPRDVLVGRMLKDYQETGQYTYRKEQGETLREAFLAVFEVPGEFVGTRLPDVWTLVGGSFDAQFVNRIHEYYQKAQAPRESTTALRQLLLPVGTFIAVVLLGMFASSQTGGGGGAPAPTNSTNINIGQQFLAIALMSTAASGRSKRNTGIVAGFGLAFAGLFGMIHMAMPVWIPILAIPLPLSAWSAIAFGVGALTLPTISAWFGRSLGGIGVTLGKLWITIGMVGYDKPVITLTGPHTYELVEYDTVDWDREPGWYRFAMSRVGIGLANDVEVWGEQYVETPARVDEMGSMQTDGGIAPLGHSPIDLISVGSISSYVPNDVDADAQYVRTDLTTGWFFEAGQNKRLMKAALETAKEKYGGGNKPVGDKLIMMATLAAMAGGAIFDWVVFF